MTDEMATTYELARAAALARFRILRVEGEEHPDHSWQKIACHVHREDLPWAAVPLSHAIATFSFADARPRGSSEIDYAEKDDWTVGDTMQRLRFERNALVVAADYVRGRMMKTTITVESNGRMIVQTRNRHEMAARWLGTLQGRRHIRLVIDRTDQQTDDSA